MKERGLSSAAIAAFKRNYDQLMAGATGMVPESEIDPVTSLPELRSLAGTNGSVKDLLKETAVLKLNGGLGTSMGLEKAKSLLEVREFVLRSCVARSHTWDECGAASWHSTATPFQIATMCAFAQINQVKDGKTFLDFIAEQVKYMREQYGSAVKFILMNSFSTSEDTRAFLSKAHADLLQVCDDSWVRLGVGGRAGR